MIFEENEEGSHWDIALQPNIAGYWRNDFHSVAVAFYSVLKLLGTNPRVGQIKHNDKIGL